MTEKLIYSVHKFSSCPIIAVHFGMAKPMEWVPERFPRLVLLHAAPFPASTQRGSTLNKLRAIILARAMAAIAVDSDMFVAPGVDMMFPIIRRETNQDYRLPMLPVHFLDKGPKDGADWWPRFCQADGLCRFQTT